MESTVQRAVPGATRSGRRRLLASAVAAGTLAAGLGVAGLAVPAGAATGHNWWGGTSQSSGTSSSSSSSTTSSCPAGGNGNIAFTGTLSNTTAKFGSAATVSGLSGTLCGLLDFSTATATIQPSNFTFSSATTTLLGFLRLPTTTSVVAPATATLKGNSTGTAYSTSMQLSMTATVSLLGLFKCTVGPFNPTMTTGTSGSVSGAPLTGNILKNLTGTLAAGDFSVPAIQASPSCPGLIAGLSNLIMGLPLKAGQSSITSTVSLTPTLP